MKPWSHFHGGPAYADRSCCVKVYLIAWTVVATGEFVLLPAPNIGWDAR